MDSSYRMYYKTFSDDRWCFGELGSEGDCRKAANKAWRTAGVSEVKVVQVAHTVVAHKKK